MSVKMRKLWGRTNGLNDNAKFQRNVAAVVAGASRPQQAVFSGSLYSDGARNYVQIHASNNSVSLRRLGEDSIRCVQDCSVQQLVAVGMILSNLKRWK